MRCRAARGVVPALCASALVVLLAAPLEAPARVLGPGQVSAAAKRKKAKCRGKKVPVKRLGRTSCRSLRSALPKPRKGDVRLIFVKAALGTDIRVRDRRGRRPPALPAAARKGLGAIAKATPEVLARFDRLATSAAFAAASAPCEKAPDKKDDFKSGDIEASVNLADGTATIGGTFNGYTVRVQMGLGSCEDGFKAPECPTADGLLRGTDANTFTVSITVLKGTEVIESTSYRTKGTTKLTGRVADDAKLDTLLVEDKVKYHVAKGGSSSGYGTVTIDATIDRTTEVKMRTGAFDPGNSSVDVDVRIGGASDTALSIYRLRNSIASDYDKSFPAIVKKAITNYKARETKWQTPNTCATLEFDPANFKKQLGKGQSGRFTGKVKAKEGGATAKEARWKRTAQANATVTPAETKGGSPSLSYSRVERDGPDVTAKFRVTSTAGVAEDSWKQHTLQIGYYRITDLVYTDALSYDDFPPQLGCSFSTGQNTVTRLEPSGKPYDGALGPDLDGNLTGLISIMGTVQKTVAFSGCKYNDTASAMIPCQRTGSGSELYPFVVDLSAPAGTGPVTTNWHPHAPNVGDVPPVVSECFLATATVVIPVTVSNTAPRSAFTDPGSHTIALDYPGDFPTVGGVGNVHSTAHYAMTFTRVNEDGSPYTG